MTSTIDFDGDRIELSSQGVTVSVLAADFVDDVFEAIAAADKANPLPEVVDPQTGAMVPGTHASGNEFIAILRAKLLAAGLDVKPNRAMAIWRAIHKKSEEYADFFLNGPSSPPPLDSPPQLSSADAAVSALLSSKESDSAPPSDSGSSTTAS